MTFFGFSLNDFQYLYLAYFGSTINSFFIGRSGPVEKISKNKYDDNILSLKNILNIVTSYAFIVIS